MVIDGLVYQSAGISLNWHAPATLNQVNELQNIRQAWRCGHCGASGTFVLAQRFEQCPECGASLEAGVRHSLQYLEPAGFSVDVFAETHNDITLQEYVPVEQPWITGTGPWIPLPNPGLGRFRSTPQGSVFHHSSGASRSGYALCLECGRAAAMGNEDEPGHGLPKVFQRPHVRLRGGKHPKLVVRYAGQAIQMPVASSPTCADDVIRRTVRDVRARLRAIGIGVDAVPK